MSTYAKNNTEENYQKEIVASKERILEELGYEPLCYAAPYNTLSDDAVALVRQNYYAMRQGVRADIANGFTQSLDPIVDTIYNSDTTGQKCSAGGWYNLIMASFDTRYANYKDIPALIDDAATNGEWLITMCHSIVEEGVRHDIEADAAEKLFVQMADYQDAGKLWVTTFGTATKYIRERQNSEVYAYKNENGTYVKVNMSSTTEDNLPLTADVFNHPLTVKVNVADDILKVSNLLDGEKQYADCFVEGDNNYVYVNVIPNSGEILLTVESTKDTSETEPSDPSEPSIKVFK